MIFGRRNKLDSIREGIDRDLTLLIDKLEGKSKNDAEFLRAMYLDVKGRRRKVKRAFRNILERDLRYNIGCKDDFKILESSDREDPVKRHKDIFRNNVPNYDVKPLLNRFNRIREKTIKRKYYGCGLF